MSWETVYWVSQLLLVVFAGVALVSGAVVNKRQSTQLLTLETNLEEQREKTALAERATLELRRLIMEPRRLVKQEEALKILKEGQKGTVSIVHADNEDAQMLALSIFDLVRWGGWTGMPPTPKPPGGMLSSPVVGVEFLVSGGDVLGPDGHMSFRLSEPANTLRNALAISVPQLRVTPGFNVHKGELIIVVGPKY